MKNIDYEQSTKILESEHDIWIQTRKFIEKLQWQSEYCIYLLSIEYGQNLREEHIEQILDWYILEQEAEEQMLREKEWAKRKTGDVLNMVFSRIRCQLPLPKDTSFPP